MLLRFFATLDCITTIKPIKLFAEFEQIFEIGKTTVMLLDFRKIFIKMQIK